MRLTPTCLRNIRVRIEAPHFRTGHWLLHVRFALASRVMLAVRCRWIRVLEGRDAQDSWEIRVLELRHGSMDQFEHENMKDPTVGAGVYVRGPCL